MEGLTNNSPGRKMVCVFSLQNLYSVNFSCKDFVCFPKLGKKSLPLTKCTSVIDNVIGCIPFQNFFDKIIEKISKTSKI